MKQLTIIIILLMSFGCAAINVQPKCWQNAVYAAIVLEGEGYETRIVYAKSEKLEASHTQVQAMVDGKWLWVNLNPVPEIEIDDMKDTGWGRADDWKNHKYYTKEDALKLWLR